MIGTHERAAVNSHPLPVMGDDGLPTHWAKARHPTRQMSRDENPDFPSQGTLLMYLLQI